MKTKTNRWTWLVMPIGSLVDLWKALNIRLKQLEQDYNTHQHKASTDLVATGTPSAGTMLLGDDSWGTAPAAYDPVTDPFTLAVR